MTSATVNSVTTNFVYRGDGLRDSRAVSGGATTTFAWDTASGLPVVLDDGNQYVYGAGLTSMKQGGSWYYYLADGLGSTLAIVDASGNSQKSYQCDVYDEVTGGSGSLANEFDFAGQQTDGTGLQYLRARYYDPETGTFLSREPLAMYSGWIGNSFSYVQARRCNASDPTGLVGRPTDPYGRVDCAGIWEKIKNGLKSMRRAAVNWRAGDYGRNYVGQDAARQGTQFTPEERTSHYNQYEDYRRGLNKNLGNWNGKGANPKPCGPPPDGPFGSLVLLAGEYFRNKTLDEAAAAMPAPPIPEPEPIAPNLPPIWVIPGPPQWEGSLPPRWCMPHGGGNPVPCPN
jgi:RHS repeat-associated protein